MSGYTPSQVAELVEAHKAQEEVWIEYSIGMFIILLRLAIQARSLGIRNLHCDDWIMATVLATYSLSNYGVEQVFRCGGTNTHLTDAERASLTPAMIVARENGTKWFFTAEIFYACVVYSTKSCMAFFIGRLTTDLRCAMFSKGLPVRKWVTYTHYMISFGYILNTIFLLAGCSPFMERFQVIPAPRTMCQVDSAFYEINSNPLNIIIDLFLIGIPLPMLFKSNLHLSRKIFIAILLSSALFTIIALLLRIVISLVPSPSASSASASWAAREWLISIAVANAPIIGPIFTKRYWHSQKNDTTTTSFPTLENPGEKSNNVPTPRSFRTLKSSSESTKNIVTEEASDYDIEMGVNGDASRGIGLQSLQMRDSSLFGTGSRREAKGDFDTERYIHV